MQKEKLTGEKCTLQELLSYIRISYVYTEIINQNFGICLVKDILIFIKKKFNPFSKI